MTAQIQTTKYKHSTRSKGYKAQTKLSYYGRWYRIQRAQLVQDWGGRCQWELAANLRFGTAGTPCDCIKQSELEFAHVKETPLSLTLEGRGSFTRLHDIRQNPDCYMLLCLDHHKILDGRDNKL